MQLERYRITFLLVCLAIGSVLLISDATEEEKKTQGRTEFLIPTPKQIEKQLHEEEEKVKAEKPLPGLSQHLSFFLRTRHPELSTLTREDATEDNFRWATAELYQPSPFICAGDFDGNGLDDTALILSEKATQKLKLMSFHQSTATINPGDFKQNTYLAYTIKDLGPVQKGKKLDTLITCQKPGKFESVEGNVTLVLRNHSIYLGYILYYFDGVRYQSLQIGD